MDWVPLAQKMIEQRGLYIIIVGWELVLRFWIWINYPSLLTTANQHIWHSNILQIFRIFFRYRQKGVFELLEGSTTGCLLNDPWILLGALTGTFVSIAELFLSAVTRAILPTICRWWVVTLSASFTSSSATGGTAFSPRRPWGPFSINCRHWSRNTKMKFFTSLFIQAFDSTLIREIFVLWNIHV